MDKLSDFLFRWRGALMALIALLCLMQARPTLESWQLGLRLALVGEMLRLWAIGYSGEATRSQDLKAPFLVTAGPYAYVRNPLYLGNLCNNLGVLVAAFYPWAWGRLVGWFVFTAGLYGLLAHREEKFLQQLFGQEYEAYRRQVRGWLPSAQAYAGARGSFCWMRSLRFERSSLLWWVLIWMVLGWWAQRCG